MKTRVLAALAVAAASARGVLAGFLEDERAPSKWDLAGVDPAPADMLRIVYALEGSDAASQAQLPRLAQSVWSAYAVGCKAVSKSNLQPDFNLRVCDRFDARLSAVLRELDESNRFVQKSAESTSI
jgi:hypothetical protein